MVVDRTAHSGHMDHRLVVFISYSHQDMRWKSELLEHLRDDVNSPSIRIWEDSQIELGVKWLDVIRGQLDDFQIAILLVSRNFLQSNFILHEELPKVIDGVLQLEKRLFILLVEPVKQSILDSLHEVQLAHGRDCFLKDMSEVERKLVYKDVCVQIYKQLEAKRSRNLPEAGGPARPRLGREMYLFCNRNKQINRYEEFLRESADGDRACHVVFAPGKEEDRNESFADLMYALLEQHLKHNPRGRNKAATVARAIVNWGSSAETGDLARDLIHPLFESLQTRYAGRRVPEAIPQLPGLKEHAFVFIHHFIEAGDWTGAQRDLLSRYILDFWGRVPKVPDAPKFMVFFSVRLDEPGRGRRLLRRIGFPCRERILKDISALAVQHKEVVSSLVLDELKGVNVLNVKEWYARFCQQPELKDTMDLYLMRIFGNADGQGMKREVSMQKVETELRILCRKYSLE